jgi:flavin reductase (DIM6/NTAB) family NADH-FMN oxidoreductase RutF
VNASALESWDDEFPIAKVTKAASKVVKPPRVAESPVQLECKVHSILRITGDSLVGHSDIVIGRVVGIHVKGEYITPDGVSEFQSSRSFLFLSGIKSTVFLYS